MKGGRGARGDIFTTVKKPYIVSPWNTVPYSRNVRRLQNVRRFEDVRRLGDARDVAFCLVFVAYLRYLYSLLLLMSILWSTYVFYTPLSSPGVEGMRGAAVEPGTTTKWES